MSKKTAATAKVEPKAKKETIGSVAITALKAGKGMQGSLDAVLAKFPDAKTGPASIYWYASQEGIKLQGSAPKKEKVVHKVAVPAKKGAKKGAKKQVVAKKAAKVPVIIKKKGPGPMVTVGKGGKVLAPKSEKVAETVDDAVAIAS